MGIHALTWWYNKSPFFTAIFVCFLLCCVFIFIYLFWFLTSFGCTSCVCVLSLPVQCWSLSYGKQRRPFRLCAPTWLRQQVWRTLNFFQISIAFFVFFPSFYYSVFLREVLCIAEWPPSNVSRAAMPTCVCLPFYFYFRNWLVLTGEEKQQVWRWGPGTVLHEVLKMPLRQFKGTIDNIDGIQPLDVTLLHLPWQFVAQPAYFMV